MAMPCHRIRISWRIAALLLCGNTSCTSEDSGPPLIVQRDSAGIEIIEALRPLWGDSSLWSIDPEPLVDLTLSGSGPPHEFFRVRGLQQRRDGSLVLADRASRQIRLYSYEGEFLGALGGPGQGPGEFRSLERVETVADTVFALDSDGRVTVVSPDMELIRTFDLPYHIVDFHSLGDGTFLAEYSMDPGPVEIANRMIRPPVALVRFDREGIGTDSIAERPGREYYSFAFEDYSGSRPPLFGRHWGFATLGRRVFYGSSDFMEVEELNLAGDIARILRVPGYGLDLTEAEVAAERQAYLDVDLPPGVTLHPLIRRSIEALPTAATRPAFVQMLVDPAGAVWLQLYRGQSEMDRPPEWLVLASDGTWLGTVNVPDGFSVTDITMDAVLGVRRDDLDVEHPQVLRLNRNGG
jgi:hypothetical protein